MKQFINYAQISTETVNPHSKNLDSLSTLGIVELMNREDRQVLQAVAQAKSPIARAVRVIVQSLGAGGRLFLVGAGTSGRLGVLEAAECPPTFSTPPKLVQAIMAGGRSAVFRSKEGAEDSEPAAAAAIRRAVQKGDVIVGIAASGVTPFVRSALRTARQRQAKTILVTCNRHSVNAAADVCIVLNTGPEVLTGSTRLKAGSACKMTLNILTTASMVRLGKVYRNYMVDLQPKSKKLVARGIRFVKLLGGVTDAQAKQLFKEARGQVKVGILMARCHLTRTQARQRLDKTKGFLGRALNES